MTLFCFQSTEVQILAICHWGLHLVKREQTQLHVITSIALSEIGSCNAPRPTSVSLDSSQGRLTLYTPRAQQLAQMVTKFCAEQKKVSTCYFSKYITYISEIYVLLPYFNVFIKYL